MTAYECVFGIGKHDASYAYLAVRPAVTEAISRAVYSVNAGSGQHRVTAVNVVDAGTANEATEFELRSERSFSSDSATTVFNALSQILKNRMPENPEATLTLLDNSLVIDGPENLFDIYLAKAEDTAVQAHSTVA